MSTTFSELAATAIIEGLSAQPESGRHLVASIHGADMLGTFRTLLLRTNDERTFAAGDAPRLTLRVLETGDGCVIVPYFVEEPPPHHPRDNRGSQGFASALRDSYLLDAESGERVMLLIFDRAPNETLLTTMSQGAVESALRLPNLLVLALRPTAESPTALKRVLNSLNDLIPQLLAGHLDSDFLGRTAQAVAELSQLETSEAVGRELHQLPCCLSDPRLFEAARADFTRRVKNAIVHRNQLTDWAVDPTIDFDGQVRATYEDVGASAISAARTGSEIDWSKFTFDQLQNPAAVSDDVTSSFAALPVSIPEAAQVKLLNGGKTVAVLLHGSSCTMTFHLTEPLPGNGTVHLLGYVGEQAPYAEYSVTKLSANDVSATVTLSQLPQPAGRDGWSFLKAAITTGQRMVKTPLDTLALAITVGTNGDSLIYEAEGNIDFAAQAYSGEESLNVIAERDGQEQWARPLDPSASDSDDDDYGWMAAGLPEGASVPVVQMQSPDEPSDLRETDSPEHLAIEEWAAGSVSTGSFRSSVRRRPTGEIAADIGTTYRPLASKLAGSLDRWKLERHVIDSPRITAFVVDANGVPTPNHAIEELALGPLESPFQRFVDAREVFFAELKEAAVPSVLSTPLADSGAAAAYIEAYEGLLSAVPNDLVAEIGYDRLLLVDSLFTAEGDVLIAPTSPLTVALHRELQSKTQAWLQNEPGRNFFAGDSALITAEHLVPYLRLHRLSGWLESGYAPYPWRRYTAFSQRARVTRHPALHRYIARRIERFLSVHPSFADERRTVRLAFVNPGTAAHVRDALLEVVRPRLRGRKGLQDLSTVPAFDLQLLADGSQVDDGVLGAELDLFMSQVPEDGQPSDTAIEVMKRLSYTKGRTGKFLQDPKAFAHLLFLEDYFQPRFELVEARSDAHPESTYVSSLATDTERLPRVQAAATQFLRATWSGRQPSSAIARIAARSTEISAAATGARVIPGIVRAAEVLVPTKQVPQLYDRASWVVHMDRYVGLELFATQQVDGEIPYILDYTDQETPEPGIFDGITATKQAGPYLKRITALFGQTQLEVSEHGAERLLRTLNLISGRWGLELLRTSDTALRGRLGLALAAQVIEEADNLHRDSTVLTLIVSLDELLRVTGAEGLSLKEGWVKKIGKTGKFSDDLLFLTVPLNDDRPQLRGRIVEVKYRTGQGTSSEEAASQIKATHELLHQLLVSTDEPGRSFQARHLTKLILRYASRHVAYGLSSEHPAIVAASRTLSQIASGAYDLDLDIKRDGKQLFGDYVSVEPGLDDSSLVPQASSPGGIDIGRIRIGRPIIDAMLRTGRISRTPPHEQQRDSERPAQASDDLPRDLFAPRIPKDDSADAGTDAAQLATTERANDGNSQDPDRAPVGANGTVNIEPVSFGIPIATLREISGQLDDVLTNYNLPLQPVQPADTVCGPNTIRFRIKMARGGTIAQVEARERDIMREMGVDKSIIIGQEAGYVTLDIPRKDRVPVTFSDLKPVLQANQRLRGELPVLFGVRSEGTPFIPDLAQLPHLLVAGSTGSGKSVFLSALLGSLALLPPSQLEIVLVDIKGLDFAPFAELPHLRLEPIQAADEALSVLTDLLKDERQRRLEVLKAARAQSILDYFSRVGGDELTQIVVVIDEFANLLGGDRATGTKLEDIIQQYAEIMRSFGVYLVIATQRPSADIVTGRIKANMPARCALQLPTHHDSMTILGRKGAEQLLGKGDMLFYNDGAITRLQAPFISAADILNVYE